MSLLLLFHPKSSGSPAKPDIDGQQKKSRRWPKPNDDDEVMTIISALLPVIDGDAHG